MEEILRQIEAAARRRILLQQCQLLRQKAAKTDRSPFWRQHSLNLVDQIQKAMDGEGRLPAVVYSAYWIRDGASPTRASLNSDANYGRF